MRKAKKDEVVKQSFKKELRTKIAFQLADSLGELKDILGEKKFNNRVRKASRLLSSGIKKEKAISVVKGKKKPAIDANLPVGLKTGQISSPEETSSN